MNHGWYYLIWVFAYLSSYSLFIRIRSMAEHAGPSEQLEGNQRTRTTNANIAARLTVAPHQNLRKTHLYLKKNNPEVFHPENIENGHFSVIKKMLFA